MLPRLFLIWTRLRDALWSLPLAIVAAAIAIAILLLNVDVRTGNDPGWWLYGGDGRSASGFIGNLLTAMITLATLAISITMVVLALAAQSLGPRLIPIFMGDARTKTALGLFIGTVAYLLLVMRTVAGNDDIIPNVAITFGALLVLTSVVVLLLFVHHLARSIVADTVIEAVGQALDGRARTLLPDTGGDKVESPEPGEVPSEVPGERSAAVVPATASGYIQAIDHDAIAAAAGRAGGRVAIAFRAGHFVLAGDTIAAISPATALDDRLADAIREGVVVGATPTPIQDLEYAVRQLVDIALRALSSGINDPNTACAVIDRLAASLGIIMSRGAARSVWRDDDGVERLAIAPLRFSGVLDAAFNQIRQAGASQPAIQIRLADRLGQLGRIAGPRHIAAIADHLARVRTAADLAIAAPRDRAETEERVAAALAAIRDRAAN